MTKEELVGRKIQGGDITYTLIEQDGKLGVSWNEGKNKFFGTNHSPYTIKDWNSYINGGSWKLLPEEVKEYQTPKGIKYGVGTKYTDAAEYPQHSIPYEIISIKNSYIHLKWNSPLRGEDRGGITQQVFEDRIDKGRLRVIQDYQSVDPTTIKFDFTNTKIRVNNREEADWFIKVAESNGCHGAESESSHSKLHFYVWHDGDICWANSLKEDSGKKYKEITIQDILNSNQMKEVIEVGDIVEYVGPPISNFNAGTKRKVTKVVGEQIYFEETGGWDWSNKLRVVSKGSKQEIVGYELLQNLPGISKGVKSEEYSVGEIVFRGAGTHQVRLNVNQLQDTTWFKPIYKAQDIKLAFSKYNATLSKEHGLVFTDNERLSFTDLQTLLKKVTPKADAKHYVGQYETKVNYSLESVAVGCKTFNKNDIELVTKAVQELQ